MTPKNRLEAVADIIQGVKISVIAFATASDALNSNRVDIEIAPESHLSHLAKTLVADYPALAPIWDRLAIAVNGEIRHDDPRLAEGTEVALLPPVSGGQESSVRVSAEPIDSDLLTTLVSGPSRGAVVLFLGNVRDHHQGRQVQSLTYSSYQQMAVSTLSGIVDELEASSGDAKLAIHHRVGLLGPGETSVGIAVASPHREAAYQLSRLALERLKREVPIWKQELYASGESIWREEESLLRSVPERETQTTREST